MNNTKDLLKVYLGGEAHRLAAQFAAQQATPQKGKQVYLNTLAVYAVRSYLKWLQIETSLGKSDSWHPGKRAVFDVADIALPDIGRLECRPVLPGKTVLDLPPEVTENRLGYVGVQFSENLSEVELLGYTPAVNSLEPIPISNLQPLDALIEQIYQIKSVVNFPKKLSAPVKFSQWLENTFEAGWQTVEAILGREKANFAWSFRNTDSAAKTHPEASVRRGKLINLGMQLEGYSVALVVAITPTSAGETDILVQVHPTGDLTYLPPHLQLIVLDAAGIKILDAQARSSDNYIQLQFSGELGECFSVKVALADVSITENFAI